MTTELVLTLFAGVTILANILLAFIQLRTRKADIRRAERNEQEARHRQNLADVQEAATQFFAFLVATEDILPPPSLTAYITMGSTALAKMRGLGAILNDDQLREHILDFITVSEDYQNSALKKRPKKAELTTTRNVLIAAYAEIILRCNELSENPLNSA